MSLRAWGRLPVMPAAEEIWWNDRTAALPPLSSLISAAGGMLAYGNGRSYGDVCLNSSGALLHTRGLDRLMAFDAVTGVMTCEAGVLLSEILDVFVPRGWFLPVTPSTRFVTVGGAIANDVHGRNHHGSGTFGCHVRRFELLRSDGSRHICSPQENAELFSATIGGMGLTGLITWVELALRPIPSAYVEVENTRFSGLDEFFALNAEVEAKHEYVVAWVDCLAPSLRGIFMAGDHAPEGGFVMRNQTRLGIPFTPPFSLVNRLSLRAFNAAYYNRPLALHQIVHYAPYFYPLDAVQNWNRIYGPHGFFQYQCVLPMAAREAVGEVFNAISADGRGSFLAVLKTFGERTSPGLMSFPMHGMTLSLDFPNDGALTLALFRRLDAIVEAAGGRLYAAKDARMSGVFYRRSYPRFEEFMHHVDPAFLSDFARRVLS